MNWPQLNKKDNLPKPTFVVRLRTETYISNGLIVFKKVLRVLKRKSTLHISEMFPEGEGTFEYSPITNLYDVEDGVYELKHTNIRRDIDGYPEEWDYQLVPYTENDKNNGETK